MKNWQILSALLFMLPQGLFCQEKIRDKVALGISIEETPVPVIRTKFKVYKNFSLELRAGVDFEESANTNFTGVTIIGSRQYFDITRYVPTTKKNIFYAGTEIDYVMLNQRMITFGDGYVIGCFAGLERYLSIGTSVSFDFGTYYTYLKHNILDVKEDGFDFVFNLLINFYLF